MTDLERRETVFVPVQVYRDKTNVDLDSFSTFSDLRLLSSKLPKHYFSKVFINLYPARKIGEIDEIMKSDFAYSPITIPKIISCAI